eukprot:TRINITY_DN4542_c0_g1_i1.p1 TRINITY_DN4542_c0_g1~~TRINITY_DN4542_c0_g1_i1.p1  ORF type:complete len:57 (-),score=3.08 TRINITY_DN4542_c0_g1_i1:33-203(-)
MMLMTTTDVTNRDTTFVLRPPDLEFSLVVVRKVYPYVDLVNHFNQVTTTAEVGLHF